MPDRTFAKFTFLKLDPAWQRRYPGTRAEDKPELLAACEEAVDGAATARSEPVPS
jgi:chlorite dismutase